MAMATTTAWLLNEGGSAWNRPPGAVSDKRAPGRYRPGGGQARELGT
jgi:hypothetical protein